MVPWDHNIIHRVPKHVEFCQVHPPHVLTTDSPHHAAPPGSPISTGLAAGVEVFCRDVSRLVEVDAVAVSHRLHGSKCLMR